MAKQEESYYIRKKRKREEAKQQEKEQEKKIKKRRKAGNHARTVTRVDVYYDGKSTPSESYQPLTDRGLNNILEWLEQVIKRSS